MFFVLSLWAVACLPGKRDNTAPPASADGLVTDGVVLDGGFPDGTSPDGQAKDQGTTDSEAGDGSANDGTTAPDGDNKDAVAPLPKGCSQDTDCQGFAISACATASCDLAQGLCTLTPVANGKPCALADVCLEKAACDGGVCIGKDKSCDDANSCTDDTCVPFQGCAHKAVSRNCNDGDPCTLADACTAATCKGIIQPCTTLQPCKIGVCAPATGDCDYDQPAKAGLACDDNNPCTEGDGCDGKGGCGGVQVNVAKTCDDKNPCTLDGCDKSQKGGCTHAPVAGAQSCSDGKPCTDDSCIAGKCVSKDVVCDDGKPCTQNDCKAAANGVDPACVYTPLDKGDCTDAEPCAGEASCTGGSCVVIKKKDCDDNNPCTKDACVVKAGGCLYLAQGGACNDGSGCTAEDKCVKGACVGVAKDCGDSDLCTLDVCDPVTAKCSNPLAPEGYACAPGKVCKLGSCKAGN